MPKRKPRKAAPASKQQASTAELRQALSRRKKVELVDVLLELAQEDRGVLRQLTARFDVAATSDERVLAVRLQNLDLPMPVGAGGDREAGRTADAQGGAEPR